jgi:hypothetical protein
VTRRHATSERRLAKQRERTRHWKSLFRPTVDRYGKKIARGKPAPSSSKRAAKRELLAIAQEINPYIRTVKGAKKLEKRLERGMSS